MPLSIQTWLEVRIHTINLNKGSTYTFYNSSAANAKMSLVPYR